MARRFVLTDASPLIGLARVDGLLWLENLFGEIWMPLEVSREVLSERGYPEETALRAAEVAGWLKTCQPAPTQPELGDLDEGEAACIRIALAQPMQPVPPLILMDERAGRVLANEHGLAIAGTAAVIGLAKSKGLIRSARAVFERLHASDFRISAQVIQTVLARVGE
jgi:predicted nucleic acid-binding protein